MKTSAFTASLLLVAFGIVWNLALHAQPVPSDHIAPLALCEEKLCRQLANVEVNLQCTCKFDAGGLTHAFCIQASIGNCYVPNVNIQHSCPGTCVQNPLATCSNSFWICQLPP